MEVHVIRHTPVDFDKKSCYGRLDVPLAKDFKEDFKKIKNQMDDDFDILYSSPLSRCVLLADEFKNENLKTDDRLLELNFGDWEGKRWEEINQEDLNTWMIDFVNVAPNNGESLSKMFDRVTDFLNEIRKEEHEKVLIITHSGVIRCIWAYLLGIPLENLFKLPVGFYELFSFKLGENSKLDSIIKLK